MSDELRSSEEMANLRNVELSQMASAVEIKRMELAELLAELAEQCRLNGAGSEREARLLSRITELEGYNQEHQSLAGLQQIRIEQLEKALREMEAMYARVWDRVDGALVCMPENVDRFEKAHAEARKALGI